MPLSVYVNFNGNCREAINFYTDVFELEKPKIMTFGETPPDPNFPLSEEAKKLIMHTFLIINGTEVMFSDVPPGMPFIAGNNISLVVVSKDMDEIKTLFSKLKAGGNVIMDLQETFWSKCYGFLTDKFGIGWQLSYWDGKSQM